VSTKKLLRERREIQNSVSCRGQEDVNTRKSAQKRNGIVEAGRWPIRCVDQASQIYQGQREEGYTHVDPANVFGRRVCAMPVLLSPSNNHPSPLPLSSLSPNHALLLQAEQTSLLALTVLLQ
jgi:hypothetical protein